MIWLSDKNEYRQILGHTASHVSGRLMQCSHEMDYSRSKTTMNDDDDELFSTA